MILSEHKVLKKYVQIVTGIQNDYKQIGNNMETGTENLSNASFPYLILLFMPAFQNRRHIRSGRGQIPYDWGKNSELGQIDEHQQ